MIISDCLHWYGINIGLFPRSGTRNSARLFCISMLGLLIVRSVGGQFTDPELGVSLHFDPTKVDQLLEGDLDTVNISATNYTGVDSPFSLQVQSENIDIAVIHGPAILSFILPDSIDKDVQNYSIQVKGIFTGRTKLIFSTNTTRTNLSFSPEDGSDKNGNNRVTGNEIFDDWRKLPFSYDVTIIRKDGPLNTTFLVCIITLVVLANIAMGCKVELAIVKEVLRRPVAPIVGLLSQFVIMPLLGLAASQAFRFEPGIALGLFATGCAPGGGASNAYAFLLDGDVSLSVTMTLISTIASFGLIPLWLFTVGTHYLYKDSDVRIPYENIFMSLAGLILPVLIGMAIKWKRPNWVKYILKAVTPLMVVVIIVIFSVGIYANLYIFKLLRPEVLAAGAILPNCGFILGGLVGIISRQPWKRTKTIAIETGLQNTGIPIVLLQVSLPKPDSDFAIVAPIAAAIFTPVLLWLWILFRYIRKKCCKKAEKGNFYELNKKDAYNPDKDSNDPDNPREDHNKGPESEPTKAPSVERT